MLVDEAQAVELSRRQAGDARFISSSRTGSGAGRIRAVALSSKINPTPRSMGYPRARAAARSYAISPSYGQISAEFGSGALHGTIGLPSDMRH